MAVWPATSWAAPLISSFAPSSGRLSTSVSIVGSGFTGATAVSFGGVNASYTVVDDTHITAIVPTLAVTGAIKVTVGSSSATSAPSFTVLPGILTSPIVGPPSTPVNVSGSGFAAREAVDIYEDATDVQVVATDNNGTFANVPVTVPAWKLPGLSWFTAVGRRSGSAAQFSFTVRTDWLDGRGSAQNNGWNRFENVLDTSSVRRLEQVWTTTGGSYLSNGPPGVIVAAGRIISPAGIFGTLPALNTNGAQLWSQPFSSSFFSGPAPADGSSVVVVPSADGKVHAYSLTSGAPKWTSPGPSDSGNGSPIVNGGDVLVPGATQVNDYNLSTGAVRWSYAGPCTGNVSTPAVEAATVLFTCTQSGGSPVLIVVGTDGSFRHWFSVAPGTTSAPALYGGSVYALFGGNLVAYSLSGYNPKWILAPPFAVSADPAAGDGIVATCGGGGIWVVNVADGSTRFTNASYSCTAAVTIANGVIYEPRNGDIVMFDEYGDLLGRLGTGGNAGPVAVSDGSVYTEDSLSGVDRFALPAGAGTAAVRKAYHRGRPNPRTLRPNRKLRLYRWHRARTTHRAG
jgi:hypothetical protein